MIKILKIAYPYQDKLNKVWQSIVYQDKYKYYNNGNYWYYKIELNDSSWEKIQMVSVDKNDNIIGYLTASICRPCNLVSGIGAINFCDLNLTFSKDFYTFLMELFTKHNFNKIEWSVVIGNPAEKMYDKIIDKYGGRVVGIRHESTVLQDGTYCDEKEYELFKRDYLKANK